MRTIIPFFFLLLLQKSSTDLFKVVGQNQPAIATVGADVILYFRLEPNYLSKNVEIIWENIQASKIVISYQNNEEKMELQDEYYKYRSEIFEDEIKRGNISLKLKDIQLSDEGIYRCFVKTKTYFDTALVTLRVGAVGSQPIMTIEQLKNGDFSISCSSSGWYPSPDLTWADNFGRDLTGSSQTSSMKTSKGMFIMESLLHLPSITDSIYQCIIRNRLMQEEKVANIKLSASLADQEGLSSGSIIAIVLFFTIIVMAGGMGWLWKNLRKKELELERRNRLCVAIQDYKLPEKDELKMNAGDLIEILEKRDSWYKGRNQGHEGLFPSNYVRELSGKHSEIKIVAAFPVTDEVMKSIRQYRAYITLDPETAHPNLILSDDNTSAVCSESRQTVSENSQRFTIHPLVLGSNGFSSGKHYWEVDVVNKIKWSLGVALRSISENVTCVPYHGYWVIMLRSSENYNACEDCPIHLQLSKQPRRIGIFLDYEGGRLSFYDPIEMFHIYTFVSKFTEKLFPYFNCCRPEGGENSSPLKIHTLDEH